MGTLLYLQNNTFESVQTLEYIVEMAKYLNMRLKIIHIQFPDTVVGHFDSRNELFQSFNSYESSKLRFMENMTKNIDELTNTGKIKEEIPFEYLSGMPSNILSYLYNTGYFDMLILENENTKVTQYPYQSIKEIIRDVKCPIWFIPRDEMFGAITKVGYMTDYQPEDIDSIRFIVNVFGQNMMLTAIHVCMEIDFEEELKRSGFEQIIRDSLSDARFKTTLWKHNRQATLPQMIASYIDSEEFSLIVLLKDNKNFIQRIFYRSFINTLLSQIKKPVLILHREDSQEDKNTQ